MVTIRYKGHRASGHRTDGGRNITFHPGEVHTFDETNKRYKNFVKKLLAQSESFEVQSEVGTGSVGGGVRTRSKVSRPKKHLGKSKRATKKEVKCPKGSYKCKGECKCDTVKKPRGLRRPKRMKF